MQLQLTQDPVTVLTALTDLLLVFVTFFWYLDISTLAEALRR